MKAVGRGGEERGRGNGEREIFALVFYYVKILVQRPWIKVFRVHSSIPVASLQSLTCFSESLEVWEDRLLENIQSRQKIDCHIC